MARGVFTIGEELEASDAGERAAFDSSWRRFRSTVGLTESIWAFIFVCFSSVRESGRTDGNEELIGQSRES